MKIKTLKIGRVLIMLHELGLTISFHIGTWEWMINLFYDEIWIVSGTWE